MDQNDLLDNDGLGLNTTFSRYIRESYGVNDFVFFILVILATSGLMCVSLYLNFRFWLMMIYIIVLYLNFVSLFNKYLNWCFEEIKDYNEKNNTIKK